MPTTFVGGLDIDTFTSLEPLLMTTVVADPVDEPFGCLQPKVRSRLVVRNAFEHRTGTPR